MHPALKKLLPENLLPYIKPISDNKEEGDDLTYGPRDGLIIHYIDIEGAEDLLHISIYESVDDEDEDEEDELMLVTRQGLEHCGEYQIDSPISVNQFRVYREIVIDSSLARPARGGGKMGQ